MTMTWTGTDLFELALAVAATGLKGGVILAGVSAAVLLLGRAAAATRHLVWLSGMAALVMLPVVAPLVPPLPLPVPRLADGPDSGSPAVAPAAGVEGVAVGVRPRATAAEGAGAGAVGAAPVRVSPSGGSAVAVAPRGGGAAVVGEAHRSGASTVAPAAAERGAPGLAGVPDRLRARVRALAAGVEPSAVAAVALAAWAGGALLLLGVLAASLAGVWLLARRTPPFPPGRVTERAGQLARETGLERPVRLLRGEAGAMPMSWGLFRPVVLLPEGAERWHPERLRSVLLHELAHVARRDCLTQVLAEAVCALHWMNPLAWLAVARLRVERERACDDRVLAAGTRPSEYATELVSLARGFQGPGAAGLATVSMARPSHLRERLAALLEEGRARASSRRAAAATVATLLAATLALAGARPAPAVPPSTVAAAPPYSVTVEVSRGVAGPAEPRSTVPSANTVGAAVLPQQATCGMASGGWKRMSHQSHDGDSRLEWSRPGCDVEVRVEGEVVFSGDFRDVERLGPGALFRIEEDDDRVERVIAVTPGPGGRPVYEYRVDRRERPFDQEARGWYEAMLVQVFRRGGFMAEERVSAILEREGVEGVLRELGHLEADHVFGKYVTELLRQASLTDDQVVSLLARAEERVDSDHYMGQILQATAARHLGSGRVLDAFLRAARRLDSDHYRAEALATALERGDLSGPRVEAVLSAVTDMDSDHYRAEILKGIAVRYALEPSFRATYLRSAASMDSDHYRAEVLGTLLDRNDLDSGELADVIRAAADMDSDHYVGEILARVAALDLSSDALQRAYFEVTARMDSDHYASEALARLLARDRVSDALLVDVVRATSRLDSDHYRSRLLIDALERHGDREAVRDAVRDALDGIASRHYRGRVAEAMVRRGG